MLSPVTSLPSSPGFSQDGFCLLSGRGVISLQQPTFPNPTGQDKWLFHPGDGIQVCTETNWVLEFQVPNKVSCSLGINARACITFLVTWSSRPELHSRLGGDAHPQVVGHHVVRGGTAALGSATRRPLRSPMLASGSCLRRLSTERTPYRASGFTQEVVDTDRQ